MKQLFIEYLESLTDEELENYYSCICTQESELAYIHYFIKEEKVKRNYKKSKNMEKKKK